MPEGNDEKMKPEIKEPEAQEEELEVEENADDKVDFAKMIPAEQMAYSREHLVESEQDVISNEVLAQNAKKKLDKFRSEHVQ